MAFKDLIKNIEKFWESEEKAKEELEKASKMPPSYSFSLQRETYSFDLYFKTIYNRMSIDYLYPNPGEKMISLDEEDLNYLYNKYLPKVEEELKEDRKKRKAKLLEKETKLIKDLEKINKEVKELDNDR